MEEIIILIIIKNNKNQNLIEYNSLFRVYKIIKNQLESGDLDTAKTCILSLSEYYVKLFKKYKNNEKSSRYFNGYVSIIYSLIDRYIDMLNKNEDMLKEPYWHRVLETSIDTLYKISEIRINDNEGIYWELDIIETIYKNFMSKDFEDNGIENFKIIFTKIVIESVGKLFKKEIRKLGNESFNDWNIKWCYNTFKEIAITIISNINNSKLKLDYSFLLNELLETAYNPDGNYEFIKNIIEREEKIVFNTMRNALSQILDEIHKNNLEYHDFSDRAYRIYIIILRELYVFKKYTMFYNVINHIKENRKRDIIDIYTKFYLTLTPTPENEKITNILLLAYDDKQNLKYELLMASLGVGFAHTKLWENYILYEKYSIEDIKKAKEELEQNLSKYVKDDEIETVKEKLNIIFESLSKISKSS
jgi:hypothetical protein